MSARWHFTPFRVGLLYASGTAMGIGIGSMVAEGSAKWGLLASVVSMALVGVSIVFGAYRRASGSDR